MLLPRHLILPVLIALLVALVTGFAAHAWYRHQALATQFTQTEALAQTLNAHVLEHLRISAQNVAQLEWVGASARGEVAPDQPMTLAILETLRRALMADIAYVMNTRGDVVASTRDAEGLHLTGNNYAFRPYFTQARANGTGFFLALGVTTLQRGLYTSVAIPATTGESPGVLVVKSGLDEIDRELRRFAGKAALLSPDGIVFAASDSAWLYRAGKPLDDASRQRLRDSRQFADQALDPLPGALDLAGARVTNPERTLARHVLDIVEPDGRHWEIVSMRDPSLAYPLNRVILFGLIGFLLALSIGRQLARRVERKSLLRELRDGNKRLTESEARLLQAERTLRQILDNAPIGIWLQDADGKLLFVNRWYCDAVGISESRFTSAAHYAELYPPEVARRCLDSDARARVHPGPQTSLEQLKFTDGLWHDLEIIKVRLDAADGQASGLIGLSLDITERRRAENREQYNHQFRELLLHLAADFVTVSITDLDRRIQDSLHAIGRFAKVDRAYVFSYQFDQAIMCNTHEWVGNGIAPCIDQLQAVPMHTIPEWVNAHQAGRMVHIPRVEALPPDNALRGILEPQGIKTLIALPLRYDHRCHGFVGFDLVREERVWSEHDVALLEVFAQLLANAQARVRAEQAVHDSEARFRALFEHTPAIAVQGYDRARRVIFWNPASERLYGYPAKEALGRPLEDLIIPETMRERVIQDIDAWVAGGEPIPAGEMVLRHRDGADVAVFSSHVMLRNRRGEPEMYCVDIDLRAQKQAQDTLRKLSLAVEQSPESIIITNRRGDIEYVNAAFVLNTGYSAEEALGKNPRLLASEKTPQDAYRALWAALSQGRVWRGEFINRRKNGDEYIDAVAVSPVRDAHGEITHYLSIQQDISAKKHAEAEIQRLAYYDSLTGLPNRALLLDRLAQLLTAGRRQRHQEALLLLNIDRFKTINDARGHAIGDQLLQAFAERLKHLVREGDTLARLTADEFAMLLPDLNHYPEQASRHALLVAEKIQTALAQPFLLDHDECKITVSLGITLFPEVEGETPVDILRRADTALHRSKAGGGNQSAFFETSMGRLAQHRFSIERELRRGIQEDGLRLYLQSQVDSNGRVVGAEALVRWQHPEQGLLLPALFIPVAEESDLIVELGAWVLTEACRLLARRDLADNALRLSVNLSPRQFRKPGFISWLRETLAMTGADPSRLTLEVTEGLLIDNLADAAAKMTELSQMGVHFSLDDFGTGYSSLAYLKQLPIDEIKIDRIFVQDAPDNPSDGGLVETILAVAKHMHLIVVAEGVETEAQAAFLKQRADVVHQGYLYGRPEPVENWLIRWRASLSA